MRLRAVICALAGGLAALSFCAAARAASPEDALRAHFTAIQAADYTGADHYFSGAFLRAFKADVEALNSYYSTRQTQLKPGYNIIETTPMADAGHETARVTVDFNDPNEEAIRTVTERLYYYLIREKVADGEPGRDEEGRAWRIDIYDAVRFDTLADARRRAYLGTKEAWGEDEGRELRSKQGFFRIQWALGAFHDAKGYYPARLLGGDNRRDELISSGQLTGRYPDNGFNSDAMKLQDFGEKSSGDYSYYSLDNDGDGKPDDYWLLLHGKVPEHYYFSGHDTIYIANAAMDGSQAELAQRFSIYWLERSGDELTVTAAVEPTRPASALLPTADMHEVLADARNEARMETEAAKWADGAPTEGEQAEGDASAAAVPDDGSPHGAELQAAALLNSGRGGDDPAAEGAVIDEAVDSGADATAADPPTDDTDAAASDAAAGDGGDGDSAAAGERAATESQVDSVSALDEAIEQTDSASPAGPWRVFSFGW